MWRGEGERVVEYSQIVIYVDTDVPGTLHLELGTNTTRFGRVLDLEITGGGGAEVHTLAVVSSHFRVRYTNGDTVQNLFEIQTLYHKHKSKHLTSRLTQTLTDSNDVELVRAVIAGKTTGGQYQNISIGQEGSLQTELISPLSAFGSVKTQIETPISEISFVYGIQNQVVSRIFTPAFRLEMIQEGTAGLACIQDIYVPDGNVFTDIGAGDFFLLHSAGDATTYYVWFDVDGLTTDPVPGGTGIEVDISEGDNVLDVLTAANAAIDGVGDFGSVIVNGHMTITNASVGVCTSAIDGTMSTTSDGDITASNSKMQCTGPTGEGSSMVRGVSSARYHPGQGVITRWSALYDTPSITTSQLSGIGNEVSSLTFGYNQNLEFGIDRHDSHLPEVRVLTITTPASGTETVTLIVDGITYIVQLTVGPVALNALEVIDFDHGSWIIYNVDNTVVFTSIEGRDGSRDGTYSFTSTGTAVANFSRVTQGLDGNDSFITQSNFNVDVLDGTGPSGMILTPEFANVYQISMQWLGAGSIRFYVENPITGLFILVHRFEQANQFTIPSIELPHTLLKWESINYTAGDPVTLGGFCGSSLLEGSDGTLGPRHSSDANLTTTSALEEVLIGFFSPYTFNGIPNRAEVHGISVSVSNDSAKSAIIRLYSDAIGSNPEWIQANGGTSLLLEESSSTTITGGIRIYTTTIAGLSSINLSQELNHIKLQNGNTLYLTVQRVTQNVEITSSVSWVEDL